MNALLVRYGPCFQAVSNEPLLSVQSAENEFHGNVHTERWCFIIHRQKHAFWPVIELEKHRANATEEGRT